MKLPGVGLQVRSRVNEENFHVQFASAVAIPRTYLLYNLIITRNVKKLYLRHDLKKTGFPRPTPTPRNLLFFILVRLGTKYGGLKKRVLRPELTLEKFR